MQLPKTAVVQAVEHLPNNHKVCGSITGPGMCMNVSEKTKKGKLAN